MNSRLLVYKLHNDCMSAKRRNFLLVILIFFSACQNNRQEVALQQRENALLEKEKQFALRENEYKALVRFRDSVLQVSGHDTAISNIWPAAIAGQWSSKVICVESGCQDYVVGDQRTDTWEFSTDSTELLTKVISNNRLVRVYTATYDGSQIRMQFQTDSSAGRMVKMEVVLADIGEKKIRGSRLISIDDKCSARFTVELDRVVKK